MYKEYDFYIPPVFDEFDSIEKAYNERIKQAAIDARITYLSLVDTNGTDEAFEKASENIFENFIQKK